MLSNIKLSISLMNILVTGILLWICIPILNRSAINARNSCVYLLQKTVEHCEPVSSCDAQKLKKTIGLYKLLTGQK